MKKKINILVIEDDEYYNNLLSNAIKQSINSLLFKGDYQLVLRSFTDVREYMRRIESRELDCQDVIVFIDYYLGEDVNASEVIRMVRENSRDTMIVLLSQSKSVKEKSNLLPYDYFVVKDNYAPAFCSLYLRQFLENKFSVTLD
jgi:DNA-binding NtrC family response regulator